MPLPIPGLNMGVNNLPRVVTVRIVTYRKKYATNFRVYRRYY